MPARVLIVSVSALASIPALASDLDGTWLRGDGNARVRISPCGGDLCATNLWIRDPGGQGEAVGDVLRMKVSRQADGRWVGTAYDPKRDINLSMAITMGSGRFSSRGCVLGGVLCRTVEWTAAR